MKNCELNAPKMSELERAVESKQNVLDLWNGCNQL